MTATASADPQATAPEPSPSAPEPSPSASERSSSATAPHTERLWIEVRDARGRFVDDLVAGDFEIREGTAAIAPSALVLGAVRRLAAGADPPTVALYLEQALLDRGAMRRAVDAFAVLGELLVELGEVELVIHDLRPEVVLTTRDPLVVSERLDWTTLEQGRDEILTLRQEILDALDALDENARPEERARIVVGGILDERQRLKERLASLGAWANARSRPADARPRFLVYASGGFDLDPLTFYGQHLDDAALRAAGREVVGLEPLESAVRKTAGVLAASGWTLVALTLAEDDSEDRGFGSTLIENTDQEGERSTGAGISIRPGALFRGRDRTPEPTEPEARLIDPRAGLRLLAEATGGEWVDSERGLGDALSRFAGRHELVYASSLPYDAGLRPLEVRAARDLLVRAPRWTSRGTSAAAAELSVVQALRGLGEAGDLDVAAVLSLAAPAGSDDLGDSDAALPVKGEIEARFELEDLYEERRPTAADFRLTLGFALPDGETRVEHRLLVGQDLTGLEEWRYQGAVEVPPGATEVAVLVEELERGIAGGSRAAVVSGEWAGSATSGPPVIEIVRPEEEILRGRVRFETRVFDRRVERVTFQLDERDVAETDREPFSARLDLGRSPRRQTLTAVAFDATGGELGRDSVILNAGGGGLNVEIIRPEDHRGTGEVEVEAEIAVPVERRIERVLFFWNSDPVATLYAPPFRQRIYIPPELPVGYVRVVAMLDDGSLAEDVVFMNSPGSEERIDVSLVELYVVVVDRDGRPVRGLLESDFAVREEGRPQEIATFSDASDLPLTLGMAIDSSASMFVKLPGVQQSAIRFLRSTFSDRDRAFVVDFDTQPRLVRSTTGELDNVVRSIETLEANGRTALWESVVYSLVQLQGVRGRKALVVFSDGADEDDEFPFKSCLSFARKMGVPIYLILMREEPTGEGLSLFTRSFSSRVDRLVGATGGRVFYAKEYDNLDEVYSEIERELRSQYLLTYYPSAPQNGSGWRDVDIEVLRQGLSPRTLSGYWP